jgi:hypothetical protein
LSLTPVGAPHVQPRGRCELAQVVCAIVESRNRRDERAARHTKTVRTRPDSFALLRALAA